jgi:glycosyltransferase involved in cell wall biosynthesis
MRVIHVIDKLNIGGAERVFIDLCNILVESKIDVESLILLDKSDLDFELSNPIHYLNRKNKFSLVKLLECQKIIKDFEIVHCHQRYVYTYISLSKFLFGGDFKIILHDHYGSIDLDKSVPIALSWFFKPDFYIGVSFTLSEWAKNAFGKNPKIYTLSNIVRIRNAEAMKGKDFDMVLVSNIKPIKNQLFAIKLAKKIIQHEEYYHELEKEILGYQHLITILTEVSEVSPYLKSAKFALHTSKSESGPLTVIEYIKNEIPFVSYSTGEVINLINPELGNMVIDNFEIELWISKIIQLESLDRKVLKNKLKNVGHDLFSEEAYGRKCLNIYKEILS